VWSVQPYTVEGESLHGVCSNIEEDSTVCAAILKERAWCVQPHRGRKRGMYSHKEGESHIDGESLVSTKRFVQPFIVGESVLSAAI
jgi:hypothetical protein